MINNRDQDILESFGKNLRKLRIERGLSQERLGLEAGLSKNQVGNIERGEVNVTLSTMNAVAKTFKIPIKDLLDY